LSVTVTDFSEDELSAISGPHEKSYVTNTALCIRRLCLLRGAPLRYRKLALCASDPQPVTGLSLSQSHHNIND